MKPKHKQIILVDLSTEPHFAVPTDGKYLVKAHAATDKGVNGKFITEHLTECNVTLQMDPQRNVMVNQYDLPNHVVTWVSTRPI